MGMIKESFLLLASNADILAAPSRLAAIPHNGTLLLEISALVRNATNSGQITLQLPGGEVPFEDLDIPANGFTVNDDVMHSLTELSFSFSVSAGGHVLFSYVETGANSVLVYATLTF